MSIGVTPGSGATFKTTVDNDGEHTGHTRVDALPAAESAAIQTLGSPNDSPVAHNAPGSVNARLAAATAALSDVVASLSDILEALGTLISGVSTATNQGTIISGIGELLASIEANNIADPATQTTLAAVLDKLTADPATNTTLSAVLAKMIAAPATEAKQNAIIQAIIDNATTVVLENIAVSVDGVSTAVKQDTIIAALGDILDKIIADPATEAQQTAHLTSLGATTDAAATGNGSIIGILKQIREIVTEQRPGGTFASVTPNSGSDLAGGACRAIMVVADGDLEFRGADEGAGSHTIPVLAGQLWPIRVRRVLAGTTATVLAVY